MTSFASNISYRAWGARKSMTYGNNVSESADYNSRLQPSCYSVSNVSYYLYPSTLSSMTWNYDYYADGKIQFVHDVAENKWDRSYAYDFAARLSEVDTNRIARGQSWDFWNPDPYQQTITYDVWGHTNRTGRLYRGYRSDTGTYTNNRRQYWGYDATGNITNDLSYQHSFDSAGRNNHSQSVINVGNGSQQFPTQPALEISQKYDGDGRSRQRTQLARQNIYDEFDENHPLVQVLEDNVTSYLVRSTVMGGAPLVELMPDGQGGATKKSLSIYAGSRRLVKEEYGSVNFELRNPTNSGWLVSNGHSSFRTTWRDERDPMDAELPMSDPYAGEYGYASSKWDQPLFIEGGDPFNYSSGMTVDGMPLSQAQLEHMMDTGAIVGGLFVGGRDAGSLDFTGHGAMGVSYVKGEFGSIRIGTWVKDKEGQIETGDESEDDGVIRVYTNEEYRGHWEFSFVSASFAPQTQGRRGRRRPQAKKRPVDSRSACDKFSEELASRLFDAVAVEGGYNPDSRKDLAHQMRNQGFNNVDRNGTLYNKAAYPISGFKGDLIKNGQWSDVYRHVLATAGNALLGTPGGDAENEVIKASDLWGIHVQRRKESETELRDDYAGIAVGNAMLNTALAGKSGDYWGLKAQIKGILCDY